VIRSKLVPPSLPQTLAARPRLDGALRALISESRLVVVRATAGSGKTTALVTASSGFGRPVAWLTVDRSETAPGRFLTYLEAALALVIPQADGVATGALSNGVSHVEATGLLAESVSGRRVVLVLDELERLGDAVGGWQMLEALLRFFPADGTVVLASRREIPTSLCRLPPASDVSVITGEELAFTPEEAADALARRGAENLDPVAAVASTSGWVTGVLFGASGHLAPAGGHTDPLYEFISSEILGQLDPADRTFLIATSLLDAVDADAAGALGLPDGGARLSSLRAVQLPVVWSPHGLKLRCHSCFREHLQDRFAQLPDTQRHELHLAHARLMMRRGQDEDAVEEFLRAGAPELALAPALRAIVGVVERLDFDLAGSWLTALTEVSPRGASPIATAELMVAIARDDVAEAVRVGDRLAGVGERGQLAEASERAGWLMAWGYLHAARFDDVDQILTHMPAGPALDVVRYAMGVVRNLPGAAAHPATPGPTHTALDALIVVGSYGHGRLLELTESEPSPWVEILERPWRIGALRAVGQTQRALELLAETLETEDANTPALLALTGPEVLIDAGRRVDAVAMLERGREVAAATGSLLFQSLNRVAEAKLALRLDRDAGAVRAALERPEAVRGARRLRIVSELSDTWYGAALLMEGGDDAALARLRRAVASMRRGDRNLELPTALIYLSEAYWRIGDGDRAADAATAALAAARRQGSDHVLLQALSDFPAVCVRQAEIETDFDGSWNRLGRARAIQSAVSRIWTPHATVQLQEFGRRQLFVDDYEVRPRIAKTYELVAFLMSKHRREASRDELLDALFEGRRDDSTRAYLRQAIQGLKRLLPAEMFRASREGVGVAAEASITTESLRFETGIAEAVRLQGAQRLVATRGALAIYDQGPYLPAARGLWADEREIHLAGLAGEVRYQAAALSFGEAHYEEARELIGQVLSADPIREEAWRLRMRIAHALGDASGVLRDYQSCRDALRELDLRPAGTTDQLLERLRRY